MCYVHIDFANRELFLSAAEIAEKRRKEKEEHSVEAYETNFQQIQRISGESGLQKLVDKFIEGENFCLLNEISKNFFGLTSS